MSFPPPEDGIIRAQSGAQMSVDYIVDVGQPDGLGRAILDVRDQHTNRNGMLHGGIIAMLLDAACGFTASMRLGDGNALTPLVTVQLNVSFVSEAAVGRRVTATGHPSGGGRKIAHIYGELKDEEGRMLATATGVFRKITLRGEPT
ncbi:PaaI family thioesterase [Aestuariivita sp.]|uniref:PaaI family thioesterase n=1 Tax=Aestuariivita sp. TaxID=1872407 RepID=UPI002171DFF5|nr:PaaI family thioesterase [Aestuariivita sp.]MCE8009775.1 PaaI family thioesterase [Aestuariivita sp.]